MKRVNPKDGIMPFTIERDGCTLTGRVECDGQALEIIFDGYGVKAVRDAGPVTIEPCQDDHPIVYVWADINQEDYTHRIELAGAKELPREDQT